MAKAKRSGKKTGGKRKISFPTRITLFVNYAFILLLIASVLAYWISPVSCWIIAFAGIAYPFLLIINLFFILFWLVFLKRYFIYSLIAVILSYYQFTALIQFKGSDEELFSEDAVKVMTYNVRLFDLYNWIDTKEETISRKAIFDLIAKENPDILCFQEYYSGKKKGTNYADTIRNLGSCKYYFDSYIDNGRKVLPFGLATFSKYPILEGKKVCFSNSYENFCLVTDILKGKDTIRVMNTHLESVRFGKEDYVFVNELAKNSGTNNDFSQGTKVIFGKMRNAFKKRAIQVDELAALIKNSPYPVILCIDLNDTPSSYSYHELSNLQKDAFADAGSGIGQTYVGFIPLLRIDYIFISKEMEASAYNTVHRNLSDHYPVITKIRINGRNSK